MRVLRKEKYMKRKFILVLAWLAVVAWMSTIFALSAQTADQSGDLSGSTAEKVLQQVYPGFSSLTDTKQHEIVENYQFAFRKTAHFSAYFLLSMLLFAALRLSNVKMPSVAWLAFVISALYAVSDEVHQLFVDGRSCRLLDIGIDALGAFCAVGLILIIRLIVKRLRLKNNA
jgi:VanZ family protein